MRNERCDAAAIKNRPILGSAEAWILPRVLATIFEVRLIG